MARLLVVGTAACVGSVLTLSGQSLAEQPQMEAALANLRQARAHLVRATPDKGGYRKAALINIDRAIEQVEAGIR